MNIENKSIALDESESENILNIDNTIRARALNITNLELERNKLLKQVEDLYAARSSLISEKLKGAGINESLILRVNVVSDGSKSGRIDATLRVPEESEVSAS